MIFLFLFYLFTGIVRADVKPEYYRAADALGMGNAYTAFVDDEHAIFYNPAGVAAYDYAELHLVTADLMASKGTIDSIEAVKTLKSPSGDKINQFIGKNIEGSGRASATLLMPHLGITGFYDAQTSLYAANPTFPKLDLGFVRTGGIQTAIGFSSSEFKRSKGHGKKNKKELISEWRVGLGLKYLTRQGGFRQVTAAQIITLDKDQVIDLFGPASSSFGGDLGVQRVQRLGDRWMGYWGAVYQNMGNISFSGGADPLYGLLNSGFAAKYDLGIASLTGSYELRQINQTMDWRKRQHAGVKLDLPLLDFYVGINQAYLTYGAAVDIGILRVTAASYREETGVLLYQNPERRYVVRVDLKLPL